ncbi:MAG: GYF domain-containing protein [Planctomycetaceae bacterium]
MGEQWYCMVVGQEVGPVTSEDLLTMLEQGQIDADDPVRAGTSGDWRPFKEAFDLAGGVTASAPTETTASVSEATWFCRMLDSEFGPYTLAEVRELADQEQLAPDDELREGTAGPWMQAAKVPGLFSESVVRQRAIELEQAREEREQKKRERRERKRLRKTKKSRSDDLLDGLDELDDVEVPAVQPNVSPFAGAATLPTDPSARTEMLQRLDAEYQRLRSQLTSNGPAAPPAHHAGAGGPQFGHTSSQSSPAAAATRPLAQPARSPSRPADLTPPHSSPTSPADHAPHGMPEAAATSDSSSGGTSRTPAADMMREMAAAQLRSTQTPARTNSRAAYAAASSSRSSGGSSFDFSSLNISGKTIGIAAAVVGVLVLGYFGYGMLDFSSGAVYDETVKLYNEFKKVADAESNSPEFTSFYQNFKKQQQQLLRDIGTPSRGSTADEVRKAVLALGTVVEAHRRPEITPAEREPFLQALDQQMSKLKSSFGR